MFDGLFDSAFDTVYHTFIPKEESSKDTAAYVRNPLPHAPNPPPFQLALSPKSNGSFPLHSTSAKRSSYLNRREAQQNSTRTLSSRNRNTNIKSSQNSRDPYARSNSAGRVDRYRPQSYQGGSYDDGYDSYDDDYSRRSSRRDRRSSKSKSRRSRSRSGIRGQLDKRFDKTQDGLTAGALGALAGGLVGHEVGKGPLATVAGVVIGGLGANAFEARQDRQEKPSKDAQAYGGRRSKSIGHKGEYEEEYYRKGRGNRGRDRYDDDDDSYDDDDRSPRRSRNGPDRKERRRQQEEREEQEKHFGWGNILKA